MTPHRVDDPDSLAALFQSAPEVHMYGLADLEEPFWSASTWYRDGNAAVGVVSVGDDWVAGYAMSSGHEDQTLDLLLEVQRRLSANTWITGPLGLANRLGAVRAIKDQGVHVRMILDSDAAPPETTAAMALTADHNAALVQLHESDPDSAFFLPSMLKTGHFVGIWDADRLIASAGTHATSRKHGVAAIGAVITHPEYRGQGLGTAVTAALVHRLQVEYSTIGLNVKESNTVAQSVYRRLGFQPFVHYEEVELL